MKVIVCVLGQTVRESLRGNHCKGTAYSSLDNLVWVSII